MVEVEVIKQKCSKCGHLWSPDSTTVYICPKCKCSLEKYPPEKVKLGRPKKKVE